MRKETTLFFDAFRLDLKNECVWRGEHAIKLTPKAFAVLHFLTEQHGQLVTKDDLWRTVWQGIAVTDATLTMCMSEVRKALGDDARAPRFIETVHRRGYRFLPSISAIPPLGGSTFHFSRSEKPETRNEKPETLLVGRETELSQLHTWLAKAESGEQQLVFVTGEPGIGKTALVEAFLKRLEIKGLGLEAWKEGGPVSSVRLARGHCVDTYGAGEAYLPVLAALDGLCRTPAGQGVVALLRQHAPMWLVQLPSLLTSAEQEALRCQLVGATTHRMLREMANFLAALTATQPLILVLEDLHWSDPSTVALLAYLARWQACLHLLVLGTYRPAEILTRPHPLATLQQELSGQGLCTEVSLPLLDENAVTEYLQQRGPQQTWPTHFVHTVYRQTEGNPLFLVAVVEEWLAREGASVQNGDRWAQLSPALMNGSVPRRLRQLVNAQMGRLTLDEQRLLEAASVAGLEFSAAEVAAAITTDPVTMEEQCERLAQRQQFLRPAGISEWPDGTVAARYSFQHAIYQSLWQDRVKAGRWRRYHQYIGERKEIAYGERAKEIATELAVHFEQGRDYRRTVQYLQQASKNAIQRSANVEAVHLLTKGLELLKALPDIPERIQQELHLQTILGPALAATKGIATSEVEKTYSRARELCWQVEDTHQLLPVFGGLGAFYIGRAALQTARDLGEQILSLAQHEQDSALLLLAHSVLGMSLWFLGEFAPARKHLEQGVALYNPQQRNSQAFLYGMDPRVLCLSHVGSALWFLGYPDQALKRHNEALALARELSRPYSQAAALYFAVSFHLFRRDWQAALEGVEATLTLCNEHGFLYWLAWATIVRGWVLVEQEQVKEGMVQVHQGITAWQATEAELGWPYCLALVANAYRKVGWIGEGLSALAEALTTVRKNGDCWYEVELYRLKGELTLQKQSKVTSRRSKVSSSQSLTSNTQEAEAESCFLKAIEISQCQQAKSLELRATTSLARLWQQQGKQREAHDILSTVYNWFTEGFDTKDLQEAKALLEELSH